MNERKTLRTFKNIQVNEKIHFKTQRYHFSNFISFSWRRALDYYIFINDKSALTYGSCALCSGRMHFSFVQTVQQGNKHEHTQKS